MLEMNDGLERMVRRTFALAVNHYVFLGTPVDGNRNFLFEIKLHRN